MFRPVRPPDVEIGGGAGQAQEDALQRRALVAAGLLVQLVDRADGDQAAAQDDADAIAQLFGDLEAVRRHEHRGAVGGEVAE
jgi:hypothetical protein